ncbi:MAG: DUF2520 domain-containing protein [Clostridia bacterium]|nr:DUF2520 domain-containing protein [Clostridia bacterium]
MDKIRIGFIGAGQVGVTLGAYFAGKGLNISGYFSRSFNSAQAAAKIVSTQAFADLAPFVEECEMIFITTADEQIKTVWQELKKYDLNNKIICHTSGALAADVFEGIAACGAYGCSIHPMYAFAQKNGQTQGLESCFFALEGNGEYLAEIISFIKKLGNKYLLIAQDKKALYHLANVFVANFVLAILNSGFNCLQSCGVSQKETIQALMPLIAANLDNIAQKGCLESLTGPVERNDLATVKKHLEVIPPQYSGLYAQLSIILADLAQQKHPARDYGALVNALSDYMNKRQ